jgi:hypothetical protein
MDGGDVAAGAGSLAALVGGVASAGERSTDHFRTGIQRCCKAPQAQKTVLSPEVFSVAVWL